MKLIKNNIVLILIFILCIVLRINADTFFSGYNYDEIAIMGVAKSSFPFGIIKNLALLDYHAPLYYFIAHFFTYINEEWLWLRLLNILINILNIQLFYKIGKLIRDKKTGYILASLLCVNHLFISLTNYVKFYTLCFLIASFCCYYLLKILKENKGYIKFAAANAFFCYSATFGFIFVGLEYIYLYFVKKENTKDLIKSALISSIGFLLYLPVLVFQTYYAFNNIISPHGGAYQKVDFYAIYQLFNDYFTPLLDYSLNTETLDLASFLTDILQSLGKNSMDWISLFVVIFLSLIPVIIAVYLLIKLKNKHVKHLFNIALIYIVIFLLMVEVKIVGYTPIYLYPAGLILLISAGVSLADLKSKKLLRFIFLYLLLSQLIIPNCYPVEKRTREQGNSKTYYCLEKYFEDNKDNRMYIMTAGGRFVEKYYKEKNIFSFDCEQTGLTHNRKFITLLYGNENVQKLNKNNITTVLPELIKKPCGKEFEDYIIENIINKLKSGEKLTYVMNVDGCTFLLKDEEIASVLKKPYIKTLSGFDTIRMMNQFLLTQSTMSDISTSYANSCLVNILDKNLKRIKIEQYIDDIEGKFHKTFSTDEFAYSTEWIGKNAINGWVFITYTKE